MSVRNLESYHDVEVVVLGAGPAGLSASLAAIEGKKRVLLIDQGSSHENYFSTDEINPLHQAVGGIGGTAKAWGGQCGTFSEIDEQNWLSCMSDKTFAEIEAGISRITSILKIPLKRHNIYPNLDSKLRASLKSSDSFGVAHTVYPNSLNFREFFSELFSSENFVYVEAYVSSMYVDDKLKTTRLNLADGRTLDVETKTVIVALGTMATTRLLKQSFSSILEVRETPLDHPQTYVMEIQGRIPSFYRKRIYFKSKRYFFKRKITFREGKRQCVFELHSEIGSLPQLLKPKNFHKESPLLIVNYFVNYLGLKILRRTITSKCRSRIWIQSDQWHIESRVNSKNGAQHLGWSIDSETLKFIKRSAEKYADVLKLIGFQGIELYSEEKIRESITHSFHPSSTLELKGSTPGQLVNQFGRISKKSNLVIASSAIFPYSGWINPTLQIMGFSYAATKAITLGHLLDTQ